MSRLNVDDSKRMRRKLLILPILVLLVGAGGYWRLTIRSHSPVDEKATDPPSASNAATSVDSEQAKTRRMLLGTWQDDYQGKRTMTLNEDGTGQMLVELSGLQATLFASKLRFDMKWSLGDRVLTKQTVGGEPIGKVNLILNTMGDTARDTILELTEDRLLLLDENGRTKYDWRRLKE